MLSPAQLLHAYPLGIFPMADDIGQIGWYRPTLRAVFPLDGFRVPRSLAKVLRRGPFEFRRDTAFEAVVAGCADRAETWLSPEIQQVFVALHQLGHAHSVEAWRDDRLVGGLYGLALGGAFFGESMFSREPEASKACLVHLVAHLRARGFTLLDSQLPNPHLARFGQVLIPHEAFLAQLRQALTLDVRF
ncbi:MAG: leucyl/phenylalanyl-tRNA--protein transferase [Candidatus Sericytochromatia bacterium]|nr:leucyl/phenylalanyl-tRNA--protein transferase [Candidatus Sericytochromatia bacterium]